MIGTASGPILYSRLPYFLQAGRVCLARHAVPHLSGDPKCSADQRRAEPNLLFHLAVMVCTLTYCLFIHSSLDQEGTTYHSTSGSQKPGKSGKSSGRKAGGEGKSQSRSAKAGLLFPECAMTEAFPNAESAFRDAFNQPDPVPKLLELITAHPDVETITDLILVYAKLVGESPTQFDKFAAALVKLQHSKGITVAGVDRVGNRAQLEIAYAVSEQLHDIHASGLVGPSNTSVTPSNEYLIDSLLSAISIKYKLCDSHTAVDLHDLPKRYRQVYILGACLQLLMSGSYLYGPTGTEVGSDDVLAALEKIKESRVVKDPDGRRLLEVSDRFDYMFYMT